MGRHAIFLEADDLKAPKTGPLAWAALSAGLAYERVQPGDEPAAKTGALAWAAISSGLAYKGGRACGEGAPRRRGGSGKELT